MNRHTPLFKPPNYAAGFLQAGGWDVDMDERYPCFFLHWHKELEILKLSGGRGEFTLDSKKYTVGDGDIVLISPQMLHYGIVTSQEPLKCRMICINTHIIGGPSEEMIHKEFVAPFEEEKLVFNPVIASSEYPDISNQIDCVVEIFKNKGDAVILIKAELIKLYGMLLDHGVFFKKDKKTPKASNELKEIIRYIEENLENKITMDELAEIAGYSKFHFIRKFKKQTGSTVTDYVNSLRLSAASDLLVTTGLPISIVGEKSGVPNTPYFIKLFKKEFFMTPMEFRKLYSK